MSLLAEKGTFTTPSGTGNLTVTTGFQPKALIVWSNYAGGSGFESNATFCMGFGTRRSGSTQQGCASLFSTDGVATSAPSRLLNASSILRTPDSASSTGQIATLSSFGATSFVLNFSVNTVGSKVCHYLIFGGTDITDAVVLNPLMDSAGATQVITGAGFQPDALFAMDAGCASRAILSTSAPISFGFGFASSATRFRSMGWTQSTGDTMTSSMHWNRSFRSDACLERLWNGSDTSDARWDIDSFDPDGFTLGVVDSPTDPTFNSSFLLIKGGSWEAGSKAKPATTTGPDTTTLANASLTPKGVILFTTNQTAVGITNASADFCIGAATAADGTQTGVMGVTGPENISTTADKFHATNTAIEQLTGGAVPSEPSKATVSNFSAGSFALNWSVNSGTANLIAYMAFGDVVLGDITASKSDAPTVTESVSVVLKQLLKSVSDAPTVTESSSVVLTLSRAASVSDAPTVTESVSVNLILPLSSFTTRRIAYHFFDDEDRREQYGTPTAHFFLSQNDAPTVTESVSLTSSSSLGVSDTSIVTDVASIRLAQLKISLSDAPTATDVIVSTVFRLSISQSDSPTVTESVSIVLPVLNRSVFDNFTTLDNGAVVFTLSKTVSDSTVITDAVSVVFALGIVTNDAPTVTDAISVVTAPSLSKNDQSIVTDAVSLVSIASISRSEAPTATEITSVVFILSTSQNDSPIVSEDASPVLSTLNISESDEPLVTDAMLSMVFALGISTNEDATATEATSLVFSLSIAKSDVQLITEAISFVAEVNLSLSDSSIVTEDADLVIKTLRISEIEEPVISDGAIIYPSGLNPKPNPADAPQVSEAVFIAIARMEQTRFLWRDDDGDEDEATALAAISTNIMHERNINARLRVQIDTVGDTDSSDFRLEFRKVSDGPDGPWTVVQ